MLPPCDEQPALPQPATPAHSPASSANLRDGSHIGICVLRRQLSTAARHALPSNDDEFKERLLRSQWRLG
jgi:hypothetical protein